MKIEGIIMGLSIFLASLLCPTSIEMMINEIY